jgi:hypothetical protein
MKKYLKGLFSQTKNEEGANNTSAILAEYENIVNWLASVAPENWKLAKVGCKVFDDSDHGTFFYLVGENKERKIVDLPLRKKRELYEHFRNLKNLSIERNEPWICCRFHVDNNGKYDVNYFYNDMDIEVVAD